MKRNLIISLVILGVTLIGILLYVFRDKIFKAKGADKNNDDDETPRPPDAQHPEFPLKWGSKDADKMYVKNLQNYLLTKDSACLPKYGADGWWGNETDTCAKSILNKTEITWADYTALGLT